jgi:hypothetical protein
VIGGLFPAVAIKRRTDWTSLHAFQTGSRRSFWAKSPSFSISRSAKCPHDLEPKEAHIPEFPPSIYFRTFVHFHFHLTQLRSESATDWQIVKSIVKQTIHFDGVNLDFQSSPQFRNLTFKRGLSFSHKFWIVPFHLVTGDSPTPRQTTPDIPDPSGHDITRCQPARKPSSSPANKRASTLRSHFMIFAISIRSDVKVVVWRSYYM